MTNKTEAAIEEAANENYWQDKPESAIAKVHFKAGMQEVIEHPERYDLVPTAHTAALRERVKELEAKIASYESSIEGLHFII